MRWPFSGDNVLTAVLFRTFSRTPGSRILFPCQCDKWDSGVIYHPLAHWQIDCVSHLQMAKMRSFLTRVTSHMVNKDSTYIIAIDNHRYRVISRCLIGLMMDNDIVLRWFKNEHARNSVITGSLVISKDGEKKKTKTNGKTSEGSAARRTEFLLHLQKSSGGSQLNLHNRTVRSHFRKPFPINSNQQADY